MAVLLLEVGCRGWVEKPIVPDTGIVKPHRGVLRVTKTDGASITIKDAVIRTDSIVGVLPDSADVHAAVARADVRKIELRGDTTPRGVGIAAKVYLYSLVTIVSAGIVLYYIAIIGH
jgi:hypothetical protein